MGIASPDPCYPEAVIPQYINQGEYLGTRYQPRFTREGRIHLGDFFNQLVIPERSIPPEAITVHGIVPGMVRDAPSGPEAIDIFMEYLGDDILVAHHAAFDLNFLNRLMLAISDFYSS